MINTDITNINIIYTGGPSNIILNYMVNSTNTIELFTKTNSPKVFIPTAQTSIQFIYSQDDVTTANKNSWEYISPSGGTTNNSIINITPKVKKFNIFFPRKRCSTYASVYKYIFHVYTFINGRRVDISQRIVDIRDSLASVPVYYNGNTYYEYISIDTIDPEQLCYSDSFKAWREMYLGEVSGINNTGSVVSVELIPIEDNNTKFIKTQHFTPGISSLMLGDLDDFVAVQSIDKSNHNIKLELGYNSYYDKTNDGFIEYLKETYLFGVDPGTEFTISYDIAILNKEKQLLHSFYSDSNIYINTGDDDWLAGLERTKTFTFDDLEIYEWSVWGEGYNMICKFSISCNEEDIIVLSSNAIACTPEVFSYLLPQPSSILYPAGTKLKLNNIYMKELKLDVVNKVQKTIVTMDGNRNNSSIIKPVFYKSFESSDISLYRKVKQNIGINLDNYKSKTDKFYILINNTYILEKARVTGNIVFAVDGTTLPEVSSGTYFVCDQNKELITTGKYNIL